MENLTYLFDPDHSIFIEDPAYRILIEDFILLALFKTIEYWWLITLSPLKKKLPFKVDKTSAIGDESFS